MTKANVIEATAAETGIEREHTGTIIEGFFKAVKSSLEKGEDVFIRGFGSFVVKKRSAKIGRNITKNVAVEIPASYVPLFKPSDEFSDKVKAAVQDQSA